MHGETAYVWVFTTFREVVYFYAETREGSLVQCALDGFKGVLVSDFYAAYDSIPCAQQKCLLHLMRDLNDAVLDNPYDESMKGIAMAFAELLGGIVKTIDRWGLKSLFLRKHLVDVDRFYKRVSKVGQLSAAASKWEARLQKDREKLFTFLSHDGVPWNNNNAEHAIKAFARLRRSIEGLSTPKGIEEYLILLSVCQTCKYSGVDFLGFLRSGETDIRTFAASQHFRSGPAINELNGDGPLM
ncbi:MAG: transposase [Candidatus Sulfotelmatobacter sp.]